MSWTKRKTWSVGLFAYGLGVVALAFGLGLHGVATRSGLFGAVALLAIGVLAWRFSTRVGSGFPISVDDLPAAAAILLLDPFSALLLGALSGLITPPRLGHWSRAFNFGASGLANLAGVGTLAALTALVGISEPGDGAFAWFACGVAAVTCALVLHYTLVTIWQRLVDGVPIGEFVRHVVAPHAVADPPLAALVVALVTLALQVDGTARLLPVIIVGAVIGGAWMFQRSVRKQVESLEQRDHLFRAIFVALARLLEMRDQETALHSARVAMYARDIAREMGLSTEQQSRIHLAGLLHDVGKVGVPDEILLKPGRLEPHERRIMERHARLSAEALADIPGFGDLTRMVYAHHERLDGSGYPEGALAKDITMGARILGVADTFEAITSDRPYRDAQPATEALRILQIEDHLFDPTVVFALQTIIARNGPTYPFGEMADFADEWEKAGKKLVVSKDEPFVLPPEKGPSLAPTNEPTVERTSDSTHAQNETSLPS